VSLAAGGLGYRLKSGRDILAEIDFTLSPGSFLAVVGENGAGKTTLLDLLMGFRRRARGSLSVLGRDPATDPWQARSRIAYLSEKVDLPGDWMVADFLGFHRRFYRTYDRDAERSLLERLGLRSDTRLGTMSAGENRRVQIVAALAARPELLIADEITAVLDILGRRLFLGLLKDRQQSMGLTTVLATNVPEGLDPFADHVLVISRGRQVVFARTASYVPDGMILADTIADTLTTHARPLR
jgi:ABC-2 type transport system ATP-binding protein